jgi:hypothetical protein
MKIIDSSTLIYCFTNNITLVGTYYVIGDLDEEFELAELVHHQTRASIEPATKLPNYNEAYCLAQYAYMLNKHAGYSFTAMRGFGDIAILALVKSFKDNFGEPDQVSMNLFEDDSEIVTVITDDNGLSKRLKAEFNGSIAIKNSKDI